MQIFLAVLFSVLFACSCARVSDKEAISQYSILQDKPLKIKTFGDGKDLIHCWESGKSDAPTVIFIHGAPGSANSWKAFFQDSTLLNHFHLLAPDRSGYGYSNFGKSELSVKRHAQLLYPALEYARKSNPLVIVVGHSYGGTIASRLAMEYPNSMDYLILAAPALDPDHEKIFPVNKPFSKKVLHWMAPVALQVANDEKMAHAEQCRQMWNLWPQITAPVLYLHGKNDEIVPFDNLAFAQQKLINSKAIFSEREKAKHRSWIHDKTEIRKALLDWLQNASPTVK